MHHHYPNLKFYNNKGEPINLLYKDGIWTGTLYYKEVSINLYESESIYMMEEVINHSTGQFEYSSPHIDLLAETPNISVKLDNSDFILFSTENVMEQNPTLNIYPNESDFEWLHDPASTWDVLRNKLETDLIKREVFRLNIGLKSDTDGIKTSQLEIRDSETIIAIIDLYGEVIGEDERFKILLSNIGENITDNLEYIFASSDIFEHLPNYVTLNEKRKEFLIEHHNITPYYTSDKGITNLLKFFGYYNLTIKKYWIHEDTGKMLITLPTEYPGDSYKKLAYFGLFYEINSVIDGEFDEFGLPITRKTFLYTNDEIIIKLFGLKAYIDRKNISGASQIIDIIGEYVDFFAYQVKTWGDKSESFKIDYNFTPSFELDPRYGHIDDVRPLVNNYVCGYPRSSTVSSLFTIDQLRNCFIGYFDDLSLDTPQFLDSPGIEVGMPISLTNQSFIVLIGSMDITYSVIPDYLTFANMGKHMHYGVEWLIRHVESDYQESIYQKIDELEDPTFILPYEGKYQVSLMLHKINGGLDIKTYDEYVEAVMKNADIMYYFSYYDSDLQYLNSPMLIEFANYGYNEIIYRTNKTEIQDVQVQYDTFKSVNYIQLYFSNVDGVGLPIIKLNSYPDKQIKDFRYVNFANLIYETEQCSRFVITAVGSGQIQVGVDVIDFDEGSITGFNDVADYLNSQTGEDVSSFIYKVIKREGLWFIDAVSKLFGQMSTRYIGCSGDFKIFKAIDPLIQDINDLIQNLPITFQNFTNFYKAFGINDFINLESLNVFLNSSVVPELCVVFFTVDNSKIAGKTSAIWTVIDHNNGQIMINKFEALYFSYLPPREGEYDVEVEIIDTNSNNSSIKKNKLIKVVSADNFYRYVRDLQY